MNASEDLADRFTRGWVRIYTRRLAPEVREERIAEIDSDLWEHRRESEEAGVQSSDVALQILARCVLGMPADVAWRSGELRRRGRERRGPMKDVVRRSWWLVPATAIALWDLALFVGQVTGWDGWPGVPFEPRIGVRLSAAGAWLAFALCMLAGLALRNRRPQRAGWLVIVGALPAFIAWWTVYLPLLGAAAISGAIVNMTRSPSPARTPSV